MSRKPIELRDPTKRFSERVENYVKYRPSYPLSVMDFLRNELQLSQGQFVADIGSGTGIFTKMLLGSGYEVYAVEPNQEMRQVAEADFGKNESFQSISATAEKTTLADKCVDLITVAQAFHWFNHAAAKIEFQRLLRPGGNVMLLWNERELHADEFHRSYEALIQKFATDYNQVKHDNVRQESIFETFFESGKYIIRHFENYQEFDFDGLAGRLLSSSYIPSNDHPNSKPMLVELRQLYERYALNNKVRIIYDTEVYVGKV